MMENDELALRLKSIIETAIDGIITINTNGSIDTINDAACKLFQYSKEELINQNIKILMPEPDRSMHHGYVHRYLETKKPRIIGIGREVTGKKKDGTMFPFRLAVSEVILNNKIIFTGIIHDLTRAKEAENQLKDLNNRLESKITERTEELEVAINKLLKTNVALEKNKEELKSALQKEKELNDLKSRFVSIASHEFRTPLSTILSSASLISKYERTDQQDNRLRHIEKIKSAVNNLTGTLSDFLDLTKLEEGKVKIEITPFNLQHLVEETFSELSGIIKPNMSLKADVPENFILHSDKRTIKNIMFNLLSNAIKYSNEGEITLSTQKNKDQVTIAVKDNGVGIPENEQKHLFERFFRASNVEGIQGTGLGLSIVKRYVETLNGSISFTSELGKGSIFSIQIPQ